MIPESVRTHDPQWLRRGLRHQALNPPPQPPVLHRPLVHVAGGCSTIRRLIGAAVNPNVDSIVVARAIATLKDSP